MGWMDLDRFSVARLVRGVGWIDEITEPPGSFADASRIAIDRAMDTLRH